MVSAMFDVFRTVAAKLVSAMSTPPTTTPTMVFSLGSVLTTNPVPVSPKVKVWPAVASGRLAGLIDVKVAWGDRMVALNVTTVVEFVGPHLMVTVPVSTVPGIGSRKD